MSILTQQTIRLNATVNDKESAIRLAGQLLVDAGHVTAEYIDGMLAREQTMSTYLGNGVAIPHGQLENKDNVKSTGISVVQVLDGIQWDDDDEDSVAVMVIGIAATADEHMGLLTNLAELIEEPDDAEKFTRTADPEAIIEMLNRPQEEIDPT